ncbi:GGDEF domain-containing protein (plasmid) [Deinococcus radiomollis]|uniref:GGDEF domain-containing protein n=1 Tax=Deinococcus radiomollis TaxID=468916 RepID=UPI0038912D8E
MWRVGNYETLILHLAVAGSHQQLLDQLVQESEQALTGVTLWREEGGTLTLRGWSGTSQEEGIPVPLPGAPDYLLGWTPDAPLPASVQAVIGLRLLYLDSLSEKLHLCEQLSGLQHAVFTDPLTGLDNRRAFEAHLEEAESAREDFVVVFIDLNGFKTLNDEFGHALGDSFLRGYGVWLSRVTRDRAHVYRLGGDEFVVLARAVPLPEAFSTWALERLQVPFIDGVSAAIGMAWRHECEDVHAVLRLADERMYAVKESQRSGAGIPRRWRDQKPD